MTELFVVCIFYSDEQYETLTEPMGYFEARDTWLQYTSEGQKYVRKAYGYWFKIVPAKLAPPLITKKTRKKKNAN